jgi:N-acetyl-1-D-myo-inositol-2-amino-2-deoxy-alpha-D-glucopyranoside deacetylase/mycothiol S-conjugate amidase
VHARVDIRRFGEQKAAAAACHKSQQGLPRRGPLGWLLRRSNRTESFMRAYPPALPGLRERDLFAGLS